MQLPGPPRDTTRSFEAALTEASIARFSGILRITGDPGGDLRFADGRIVLVSTSGAPGFELLERSGDGQPLGTARVRLLRMTAAVDATFAITAGWIDRCHRIVDPGRTDGFDVGYEVDWLLGEVERRLRALADAGISPYRNLLALTDIGRRMGDGDGAAAELLRAVDGNRSCRELAFLLGRPLYPVTVEVTRLLADGRLTVPARHAAGMPPVTGSTGLADPVLPRRRRGASGINDTLRPRAPQPAPASATAAGASDAALPRSTERIR